MMAIAEAKLLESGVLNPQTAQGGSYAISRRVPNTETTVLWGNDEYRYHNVLVTTELIKTADRAEMRQKWAELRGSGTYLEWAKTYLAEKAKLDKALAMELMSQSEYEVKLAIAKKKYDNLEEIRKVQQLADMNLITKEEKEAKIKELTE